MQYHNSSGTDRNLSTGFIRSGKSGRKVEKFRQVGESHGKSGNFF